MHITARLLILVKILICSTTGSSSSSSSSSTHVLGFGRLKTPPVSAVVLKEGTTVLRKDQFAVFPHFLCSSDLADILADVSARYANGELKEAGVKGSKATAAAIPYAARQQSQVVSSIRNTATDWLDYLSPRTEVEGRLLQYLDAFRMQLCADLDLDLDFDDTEVLYARYPVGGFYRAHCDSHSPGPGVKARDTERRLSFVLFINAEAWHTTDGGSLRILGTEAAPWISPVDIDPVPGTLVLFLSRDLRHEVLETTVVRNAVVGWFRVRSLLSAQ